MWWSELRIILVGYHAVVLNRFPGLLHAFHEDNRSVVVAARTLRVGGRVPKQNVERLVELQIRGFLH